MCQQLEQTAPWSAKMQLILMWLFMKVIALHVLLALRWLHELGVDTVIIETDWKIVVDSINSNATDVTDLEI